MSNINNFLVQLQHSKFHTADGAEVLYGALGDGAFNLGLPCIFSYYRELGGVPLTGAEVQVNGGLKSARMSIEHNYGSVNSLFHICDRTAEYKLGKWHPYAGPQLRVCHLLTNCYNCLNGDSTATTFECQPPSLESYLAL